MTEKAFIVKDLNSNERRIYAVVTHGEAFDGKWKRKVLWVHDWFEKLDDACACAFRMIRDLEE